MKRNQQYSGIGHKYAWGGDWETLANADKKANPWDYADDIDTVSQYKNSTNKLGISKQDNPFSKGNIGSTASSAGAAILNTPEADKLLDTLDPMHHLAGGRESTVGNALDSAGKGLFKAGVQSGNPWLMLAGAGAKSLGGLTNRAFGVKLNKENISDVNSKITGMYDAGNRLSSATTSTGLLSNFGNTTLGGSFDRNYIGKNGWWNHKATKTYNKLRNANNAANNYLGTSLYNAGLGVDKATDTMAKKGYIEAYGGPIDTIDTSSPIGYGFMNDYITMKNKQTQSKGNIIGYLSATSMPSVFANGGDIHIDKNKRGTFTAAATKHGMGVQEFADHVLANPDKYSLLMRRKANFARNFGRHKKSEGGNLLIGNNGDTSFALGGDLQTNGADYSDGLREINAGKSHEENPYEGVQMGMAPDNTPNLVEEGETIFDDYVFSNRIKVDNNTKKKFHIGKNRNITYAELSKKLEKEAKERPNDPISKSSLKAMLSTLAEAQETQKAKEQAKEAMKAFEAMSPEEQQAEQQAQEQQEVPVDENGNPVDQQALQQQYAEQPVEEQIPESQEAIVGAYGGQLNHRFDDGGTMPQRLASRLGLHTQNDINNWLANHNMANFDWNNYDWNNLKDNDKLLSAIATSSPQLANAIKAGYDFGVYTPILPDSYTFDFKHGGWGTEDYDAWNGSNDAAWKEAVANNLVQKGMNSEAIDAALKQTNAYKRGTQWLQQDENNRLKYLQAIYNSNDAPKAARDYAAKFVDNNGWLKDAAHDYNTIFGEVRTTHPGTYWKTPEEVLRESKTVNRVINEDGTIEDIIGNVPTNWGKPVDTYNWDDQNSGYTYNYYKRPSVDGNPTEASKAKPTERIIPYRRGENLRYAGALGPLISLTMQASGIGKPDNTELNAAMNYVRNGAVADYQPIGNYLKYTPMDIWAEQNRMDANSRATDRAIANSNLVAGSQAAAQLANSYISQLGSGDLYSKALTYNDTNRQKVGEFNKDTDKFNAESYTKTSATNADLANRRAQFQASLAADIAKENATSRASWYKGIYGNISNFANNLARIGDDTARANMIIATANSGAYGRPSDVMADYYSGQYKKKGKKSSKGGKLKKRRGYTF